MSNNDYTYIIEFLDDDGTLYIYDIDDKIQSKLLGNFFIMFWGLSLQLDISCNNCIIRKVEKKNNYKLNSFLDNKEKYVGKIYLVETDEELSNEQLEKISNKYIDFYKKHTIDFLEKLENINDLYNKLCNIIEFRSKSKYSVSQTYRVSQDNIYGINSPWYIWNDYSLSYESRILIIVAGKCDNKKQIKAMINYYKNIYKKIKENKL